MAPREPTPDEARLLRELLCRAGYRPVEEWLASINVQVMDDGGMGSLRLLSKHHGDQTRTCGKELASPLFLDADGVDVIATLYAGESGEPFELDMWKTDFRPLLRIPNTLLPLEE